MYVVDYMGLERESETGGSRALPASSISSIGAGACDAFSKRQVLLFGVIQRPEKWRKNLSKSLCTPFVQMIGITKLLANKRLVSA